MKIFRRVTRKELGVNQRLWRFEEEEGVVRMGTAFVQHRSASGLFAFVAR